MPRGRPLDSNHPRTRRSDVGGKVSKQTADFAAIRRVRALKLRVAGASIRQIARLLQIGIRTAKDDVDQALEEVRTDMMQTVEAVRDLDLMALDEMQIKLYKKIRHKGAVDKDSVFMVLKIMERRAKYLGLDSPAKVDLSGQLNMATVRKILEDAASADDNKA